MKKNRVIKTQDDLNKIINNEKGLYYISVLGNIVMFDGKHALPLLSALQRMEEVSIGTSEAISEAMISNRMKEAREYIELALKTYLIPFRYH